MVTSALVRPGDEIAYRYLGNAIGDHAPVAEILAALSPIAA